MASKSFYTACACVLFDRNPNIDAIATALSDAGDEIGARLDAHASWQFRGPTLYVAFRPDVLGFAWIDLVDRPWPDDLGRDENDPTGSGSDRVAAFGPFTAPDCLARASRQSWSWPDSRTIPERHKAFVRVRMCYVNGIDPNPKIIPPDYDPVAELDFVVRLTAAITRTPGAIAYFNPAGEVLKSPEQIPGFIEAADAMENLPTALITDIRYFDFGQGWIVMDTVGNSQFSHPDDPKPMHDFELCVAKEQFNMNQHIQFLVYATLQIIRNGPVDRPSGSVVLRRFGLVTPARPTVRFFSGGGTPTPPDLFTTDHDGPVGIA